MWAMGEIVMVCSVCCDIEYVKRALILLAIYRSKAYLIVGLWKASDPSTSPSLQQNILGSGVMSGTSLVQVLLPPRFCDSIFSVH